MSKFARILAGFLFVFCMAQAVFAATYTVTKTADSNDGACNEDCSLREAVLAANSTADNDTIGFDLNLFRTAQTIVVSLGEIVIFNNGTLTINGTGAEKLTISGNNASRILATSAGVIATINNATLTAGTGTGAANSGRGGAIYNNGGNLTLNHVVVTGNTAANGGALSAASSATTFFYNSVVSNNSTTGAGGGMQNFSGSTLTITNTTFMNNVSNSTLTGGGAILANGTLIITNSTFSGNRAQGGDGGALYYNGQGLTMNNVTIGNNFASTGASGLHKGTSLLNANIRNTLIGGNLPAGSPDVFGAFNSQGTNLIGNTGASTGWIASDILNQAPLVSPLGFYGGRGMTHALLSGSPAIDGGQNCVTDLSCAAANPPAAVATDQRGAARPFDSNVDIGAYEVSGTFRAVLPFALLNQPYNFVIAPDNGGFTYSVTSGTLPNGINLTTAFAENAKDEKNAAPEAVVALTGAPTETGTFDFAVTITNGTNSAVVNYRLFVLSTAPGVTIGGSVTTTDGAAVAKALVFLSYDGEHFTTRTNDFGNYRFHNIPPGATVTIRIFSKEYVFDTRTVTVTDNLLGLDFTTQPK